MISLGRILYRKKVSGSWRCHYHIPTSITQSLCFYITRELMETENHRLVLSNAYVYVTEVFSFIL